VYTLLSFLNTNRYPPSLLFLLMTLGPALLILRWTDREVPGWLRPLIHYGRAPFFDYFTHFALIPPAGGDHHVRHPRDGDLDVPVTHIRPVPFHRRRSGASRSWWCIRCGCPW
jgi:hypothetical protein